MTREYPARPIVGVGTVVWHGDRVVLVQRGRPPRLGQWSLPGGAQRLGESLADAARREVFEETGLVVDLGEVVATLDSIERDPQGRIRYHYTLIDFTAEARSDELVPGDDAAAARWFGLAELEALGLWSETLRVIELARQHRCRCGRRTITPGT
ncbi:MAG TPA: NUDIX hydrolase [Geminicoccaceae bacterium]|nr:NUDIX hydrolase [Geminicoccaceae bacterium]